MSGIPAIFQKIFSSPEISNGFVYRPIRGTDGSAETGENAVKQPNWICDAFVPKTAKSLDLIRSAFSGRGSPNFRAFASLLTKNGYQIGTNGDKCPGLTGEYVYKIIEGEDEAPESSQASQDEPVLRRRMPELPGSSVMVPPSESAGSSIPVRPVEHSPQLSLSDTVLMPTPVYFSLKRRNERTKKMEVLIDYNGIADLQKKGLSVADQSKLNSEMKEKDRFPVSILVNRSGKSYRATYFFSAEDVANFKKKKLIDGRGNMIPAISLKVNP